MAHLENVCLRCGDKLQLIGIVLLSKTQHLNMKNEIFELKSELKSHEEAIAGMQEQITNFEHAR
jgi:hypothetical protein